MAYLTLTWAEVSPLIPNVAEDKGKILLEDVLARAIGIVPELGEDMSDPKAGVAKAVVRKAVVRWADSGSGGTVTKSQTAGPYNTSETYENRGDKPLFYNSEIEELKALFATYEVKKGKAFSINLVPEKPERSPYDFGW